MAFSVVKLVFTKGESYNYLVLEEISRQRSPSGYSL